MCSTAAFTRYFAQHFYTQTLTLTLLPAFITCTSPISDLFSSATKENLKTTPLGDGPLNHLASAFAAGITSNTLTNPLWMVKTRFQLMADTSRGQVSFVRRALRIVPYTHALHLLYAGGVLPNHAF